MPDIDKLKCDVARRILDYSREYDQDISESETLDIGSFLASQIVEVDGEDQANAMIAARKEALVALICGIGDLINNVAVETLVGKTHTQIFGAYQKLLVHCFMGQSPQQVEERGEYERTKE